MNTSNMQILSVAVFSFQVHIKLIVPHIKMECSNLTAWYLTVLNKKQVRNTRKYNSNNRKQERWNARRHHSATDLIHTHTYARSHTHTNKNTFLVCSGGFCRWIRNRHPTSWWDISWSLCQFYNWFQQNSSLDTCCKTTINTMFPALCFALFSSIYWRKYI